MDCLLFGATPLSEEMLGYSLRYHWEHISEELESKPNNSITFPANRVVAPYQWHCFASQLVEIYVNVNIGPLSISRKPLAILWQTFLVDHHFCPAPDSLLSHERWFLQLPKGSMVHLCWSHSAFNHHCIKISSQTKVTVMPTNIRPGVIANIVRFSWPGLSQKEMSRNSGVSQGAM